MTQELTVKKKNSRIQALCAAIVAFALILTIAPVGAYAAEGEGTGTPPTSGYITDDVFDDLNNNEWYMLNGWVPYVYGQELMMGYVENGKLTGKFGPGNAMDRAQSVTTLYRIAHANDPDALAKTTNPAKYEAKDTTTLKDLKGGQYYTAAVNWAYDEGIITGYKEGVYKGTFRPYGHITREELTTTLWRYADFVADLNVKASTNVLDKFPDKKSIQPYAKQGMAWAAKHGILSGYDRDGKLHPQDEAERAQLAKILTVFDNEVLTGVTLHEWKTIMKGNTQIGGYWKPIVAEGGTDAPNDNNADNNTDGNTDENTDNNTDENTDENTDNNTDENADGNADDGENTEALAA